MFERILTTKQLAALGAVVAEAARIESILDGMLQYLSKLTPAQYAAFNSGTTMLGRKIEILRVFGEESLLTEKRRAALNRILDSIAELNRERVVFVHGQWNPDPPPPNAGPISIQKFFGIGVKPTGKGFAVLGKGNKTKTLTAARLHATAAELRKAYNKLRYFWRTHLIMPKLRQELRRQALAAPKAPK
jgi:hypothetical protein